MSYLRVTELLFKSLAGNGEDISIRNLLEDVLFWKAKIPKCQFTFLFFFKKG